MTIRNRYVFTNEHGMEIRQYKSRPDKPEPEWRTEMNEVIENAKWAGCRICGAKKRLHFHHIRPEEKAFSISKRTRRMSLEQLKAEIEKCVVLCLSCHMRLHRDGKPSIFLVAPGKPIDPRDQITDEYSDTVWRAREGVRESTLRRR